MLPARRKRPVVHARQQLGLESGQRAAAMVGRQSVRGAQGSGLRGAGYAPSALHQVFRGPVPRGAHGAPPGIVAGEDAGRTAKDFARAECRAGRACPQL